MTKQEIGDFYAMEEIRDHFEHRCRVKKYLDKFRVTGDSQTDFGKQIISECENWMESNDPHAASFSDGVRDWLWQQDMVHLR